MILDRSTQPHSNGWRHLDKLGTEYHELVESGFGTSVENRSDRQIEIAQEIIARTIPYMIKIAKRVKNGFPNVIKTNGKRNVLSIARTNATLDKFVSESSIRIIKGLHNYDPSKCAMSSFIHTNALGAMHRYAEDNTGITRIPLIVMVLQEA